MLFRSLEPEPVVAVLERYKTTFPQALTQAMNRKLGLTDVVDGDADLQRDLLTMLQDARADWTVFWRRLSHAVSESEGMKHAFEPVRDLFADRVAWESWLSRYIQRLHGLSRRETGLGMLQVNPKYVLRNHLGELAIRQAQSGQFHLVADLLAVLQRPFDEHPQHEEWAGFAPEWASSIQISCSS